MVTFSDDVIILARTRMKDNRVCVGGYSLEQKKYVRLLTENAENQIETAPYKVGQFYSITYQNRQNTALPHSEDICVLESNLIDKSSLESNSHFMQILGEISTKNIHIKDLFDGLLHWENGKGFLSEHDDVLPNYSVMVVTLNHDLFLYQENRFRFLENGNPFTIKYVGTDNRTPKKITAGTFLRFSLARWWDKNGEFQQKRAYLQLSAIY